MGQYTVYAHINKINGKRYIGITKQIPELRWGNNGRNYCEKCICFWNAIQKYGWDNFNHIIIADNLSKEQACQLEIDLIKRYQTQNRNFGYNILPGGNVTVIPEDVKVKISKSMMGNQNSLGHPCSEEKKLKISKAQKGKSLSEQHKANLRKPKSVSYPCSEEKRQKIIDAKKDKKPVYCTETDVVYPSVHECARQLGLQATLISKVCKGKAHTTGGYHFKYYI